MGFDLEEILRVIATATSTMSPRGQEIMLRVAKKIPDTEEMAKGHIGVDFAGPSIKISVTDWPEWDIPDDLRIRAD